MTGSILFSLAFFLALLASLEIGRWLRLRNPKIGADDPSAGTSTTEGVVFALLGLLIAFTFTSSASRFDERRKLIVDQANALGTAWLRTDLLPESDREPIRQNMREWVKLSLDATTVAQEDDLTRFNANLQESQRLQNAVWQKATTAVQSPALQQYSVLVLPPINEWIDLTTTRIEMIHRGVPPLVMPTLVALSLAGAVLAGFNMAKQTSRSLLHMLTFAGAIAFSMYVIMDLNHPRAGLIRIDAVDDVFHQLYATMTSTPSPTSMPATPN